MCETVRIDPAEVEHILLCWPISLHVAMPCLKHPEENLGVRILTGVYSHMRRCTVPGNADGMLLAIVQRFTLLALPGG